MTRRTRRTALALTAAASSVALAAPAFGAGVDVTLIGVGGTRQFSVEDVTGATLTAIDLGTGGATPFRTHIADSSYLPADNGNYTVDATLTNLYLKDAQGGYVYSTKIPSSAARIGLPAGALAATGLSLSAVPRISVAGTLGSCLGLDSTLAGLLGINPATGLPLLSNSALTTLCTTLGVAGGNVAAVIDGAIASLTPTVNSLLDLPTALTGGAGGAFTNPSFASGTAGFADPAKTGTAPTSVRIMNGNRALSSTITGLLDTAFSALDAKPLTSVTAGAGKLPVASIIGTLTGTGSSAIEVALGNALSTLSSADQVAFLNNLLAGAVRQVPIVGDLLGVTGDSFAFPVLTANPATTVAGTYGGTMTVTFVQT